MNPESTFSQRTDSLSRRVNAPYLQFLDRLGLLVEFVKAEGACVLDRQGKRYIDCIAGYGNLHLGHNHPAVTAAYVEELTSSRPFNLPFLSEPQARLAEKLADITPGDLGCSLFVNSGSEAVDSALKLARLALGRTKIVAMEGAWHGFTFGAMSVSEPAMCRSFQPLLTDVAHVPYGDLDAAVRALGPDTAAVIVEPVQAESGARIPPEGYLSGLAEACRSHGTLLIFDEVKSGMAKTGRMFACEHDGAIPDVILCGKALGGGVAPIGTVTAHRRIWSKVGLSFPMSSSSAGGNAPACAASLAAIEALEREDLCIEADRKGIRLSAALCSLADAYPEFVTGASGKGLLQALHTSSPATATAIIQGCVRRGVLVMTAFCNRSRILVEPPLNIEDALLDEVLDILDSTLSQFRRDGGGAPRA